VCLHAAVVAFGSAEPLPRVPPKVSAAGAHWSFRMPAFELGRNRTGMSRGPRPASHHRNRRLLAGPDTVDPARRIMGIVVF
jgi:hypothetical protein